MTTTKIMGVNLSVFNGHVNDASRKARALMGETCPDMLAEVDAIEVAGNGIMAIFNEKPTLATTMFSTLVFAYVNEHLVTDQPRSGTARDIQL